MSDADADPSADCFLFRVTYSFAVPAVSVTESYILTLLRRASVRDLCRNSTPAMTSDIHRPVIRM